MNQKLYGVLFGISAFTAWGFLPVYWKQMQAVNPFEILCHRVVWSCIFLSVIIHFQKRWGEVHIVLKHSKNVETLFLFIPALIYILYRQLFTGSYFLSHTGLTLWMIGAGIVTTLPLLWFAQAAKSLNLSTIGILQYLAPSISFLLGVFVYKENFTIHNLITFGFIWAGVVLYTLPSVKKA